MESTRFVGLERSRDGSDLYSSHKDVVTYWTPLHAEIEVYYDNLRGKQWTDAELEQFKRKKKHPTVLNQLKPAERTILGLFIQNKYDVKFSPREPGDQDISDVLQKLYAYTRSSQDWGYKDIELVRQAWTGGMGYQEFYVRYTPGQEPVLCTQPLNPFCLFWDPESRIPITREDAEFVDRDTWVPFSYLQEQWPDIFQDMGDMPGASDTGFVPNKAYADRSALFYDQKNNRYKLTERLYKVRRKAYYAMDREWNRIDIPENVNPAKYKQEGYGIFHEMREFLHIAVICPAWDTSRYLLNEPYHCQPRDPDTGKIMWPWLELAAETLNGDPSGFVKHLVEINRLINSAAANIFHANKHAASTSLLRKKKLFGLNDRAAKDFDKNHVDSDRVFEVANDADLSADIAATPKGFVSTDTYKTYEMGQGEFNKISSSPPHLQGQAEEAGVSGVLNAQRIEQSFTQLQPLIANIKAFLRQRAKLAYYYWREYWDYPKTFRVTNDEGKADFLTINGEEAVKDWKGRQTGALKKINDINAAMYDVTVEESTQSPTHRAKVQQQLSDVMTKLGSNVDPELLEALVTEWSRQSDMSQEIKDHFLQHMRRKAEAAKQPPQPPPPEPPKLSFSLKGEDLQTPMGMELMRAFKVLPEDVLERLAGTGQPQDPNAPAQAEQHAMDLQLKKAKVAGQELDNARKMQDVADNEANALAGPPPSAGPKQPSFAGGR